MNSAVAVDHLRNLRNQGRPEGATHMGMFGEVGEGPWVRMWLVIDGDTITRAGYETYGCPVSIITASLVAQIVTGRTVDRAALLEPEDVVTMLGEIPPGKGERPVWAVTSLRNALQNKIEEEML